MVCLINIVSYLVKQQIKTPEKEFIKNGKLSVRMPKAMMEERNKKQ